MEVHPPHQRKLAVWERDIYPSDIQGYTGASSPFLSEKAGFLGEISPSLWYTRSHWCQLTLFISESWLLWRDLYHPLTYKVMLVEVHPPYQRQLTV